MRLSRNQGKGAAVMYGLKQAYETGYTHALQVDADGQHDISKLDEMIEISKTNYDSVICADPQYDRTIPLLRKLGRYINRFWVWVETLSFGVPDSMIGYRIYPLKSTINIIRENHIGRRMEFDTEIIINLLWGGTPYKMFKANVIYPPNNHSNFRMIFDNVLISIMHMKLLLRMLFLLPTIIKNRHGK